MSVKNVGRAPSISILLITDPWQTPLRRVEMLALGAGWKQNIHMKS